MPRPFVEVYFSSSRTWPRPVEVEITREDYSHEMAVLTVRERDLSAARYRSGSPVFIRWGSVPKLVEHFYGYVHHTLPSVHDSRDPTVPYVEVVCIGASRPFSEPKSRSWIHTRLDFLVEEIAQEHRFNYRADKSLKRLSNVTQGGESSWKFLCDLARENGMTLYPNGTELVLRDRDKVLDEKLNYAPVIGRGGVSRLKGVTGETNPSSAEAFEREGYGLQGDRLIAYRDTPRGNNTRENFEPDPRMKKIFTEMSGEDRGDLEHTIESERKRDKYLYQITASIPWMPRLQVADPVVFDGLGERYDGPWSINRARFSFNLQEGEAFCDISASRFESQDSRFRPRHSRFRPRSHYDVWRYRRAKLVGDQWVSEAA